MARDCHRLLCLRYPSRRTASHGQEGMKLIQEKEPHIVLTDITMPIMDAFMMFEATRTLSYEKVILSGYNDFQNAKKAMQYGAVDSYPNQLIPRS